MTAKHNGHFTFESVIDSWAHESSILFVVAGLIAEALLLLLFICSAV